MPNVLKHVFKHFFVTKICSPLQRIHIYIPTFFSLPPSKFQENFFTLINIIVVQLGSLQFIFLITDRFISISQEAF